jgi:DNA-binding NtrC family response regulator
MSDSQQQSHPAKPRLLIVDDDPLIRDTLEFVLSRDFTVRACSSRTEAVTWLREQSEPVRLALVDLGLPPTPQMPIEGFRLISELLAHAPSIKILVLSGQNEESNARRARALGAVDLVPKPCEPEHLKSLLFGALKMQDTETRAVPDDHEAATRIVGDSPPIQKLRSQIALYAGSIHPVLIEGESGSGKERVAASLHHLSPRARDPYLALNCAAISPTLVEPTLFGYSKGSFTGAVGAKSGYFEDAGKGTLFLDEIGELPLDLQAKLLRVLENGEFQRVGETQTRVSRARVIAATNRDLRKEVRAGRCRADLYHRLSVFTIDVPPLRELGNDKILLLDYFRELYARQSAAAPFQLNQQALAAWSSYSFPGNVRELKNIIIRLTTKYAGHVLGAEEIVSEFDLEQALEGPQDEGKSPIEEAKSRLLRERNFNLDLTLRETEQAYIEAAMALCHGNVSQAAKLLGVNRTTLYSRMEALQKTAASKVPADL